MLGVSSLKAPHGWSRYSIAFVGFIFESLAVCSSTQGSRFYDQNQAETCTWPRGQVISGRVTPSSDSKVGRKRAVLVLSPRASTLSSRNSYFSALGFFRTPRWGHHLVSSALFLLSAFPHIVLRMAVQSGLFELLVEGVPLETNLGNGSFEVPGSPVLLLIPSLLTESVVL